MSEILAGGRYTVLRRIAVGGMGEVLLADFPGDSELPLSTGLVVIKRILSAGTNREHHAAMLREEGRLGVRLLHGNVVETFYTDEDNGDPLLIMEYLSGRALSQVLGQAKKRKERIPIEIALKILRGAACGLHFAHTLREGDKPLGLVHRDVSPANIFVTFDGRVKVIDFGVAKADDSEIRTSTGILKGKLGYMSPEQALGAKLTAASDLWALGVVFWETLCAERLFGNASPTVTLAAICDTPAPSPHVHRPEIPDHIEALCMKLLQRRFEHRICTGRELVETIDALPESDRIMDADVGAWLSENFPNEAELGRSEAARAARYVRSIAVPEGLAEGTAISSMAEQGSNTVVLTDQLHNNVLNELENAFENATDPNAVVPSIGEVSTRRMSLDLDAALDDSTAEVNEERTSTFPSADLGSWPGGSSGARMDLGPPRTRTPVSTQLNASSSQPPSQPYGFPESHSNPHFPNPAFMPGGPQFPSTPPMGMPSYPPQGFAPGAPFPGSSPYPEGGQPFPQPQPYPGAAPGFYPQPGAPSGFGGPPPGAPFGAPHSPFPPQPAPAAWPGGPSGSFASPSSPGFPASAAPPAPPPAFPTSQPSQPSFPPAPPSLQRRTTGSHRAPQSSTSRRPTQQAAASSTSTLGMAFGGLAIVLGLTFSWIAPQTSRITVAAVQDVKGANDILYAAVDAPANARVVDLDNAEVRLGGRWREVTREELMPLLEESGVWRRANLPTTPRARLTTLLPILLIAIGCFALVIAGPAFFDRNERRRLVVQGLLVAVTLAGLVFALNTGFLSWPGLKAWREPAMLVLEGKLKS